METVIANVGSFVTAAVGWVSTVAGTIVDTPILMLSCVCLPIGGYAVGYFKRLLSARA